MFSHWTLIPLVVLTALMAYSAIRYPITVKQVAMETHRERAINTAIAQAVTSPWVPIVLVGGAVLLYMCLQYTKAQTGQ